MFHDVKEQFNDPRQDSIKLFNISISKNCCIMQTTL